MSASPLSVTAEEFARQQALDRYRIVDSLPEGVYDDIVRVAAGVCGTPIALVSLLDRDRQWFKAQLGMSERETPRDVAVCEHAVREPDTLMEIRDLREDARFAHFPIVSGALGARFYAGMPLVTPEGAAIGTVCVLDHQPRTLSKSQRAALHSLARITMNLLEGSSRERSFERAAQLSSAVAAAEAAAAKELVPGLNLVILELQDFAAQVERLGERAVEKALCQLNDELDVCLRGEPGDSVSRVTGSPEFIAVLHGGDREATVQRLREIAASHWQRSGLCTLIGAAQTRHASEAIETRYLRADSELSAAKIRYSDEGKAAA